jgi:hypothetical protein
MFVELMKKDNVDDPEYVVLQLDTVSRFSMEKEMYSNDEGILRFIYSPPRPVFLSLKEVQGGIQDLDNPMENWIYASHHFPYVLFWLPVNKKTETNPVIKAMLSSFNVGISRGYYTILNRINSKATWDEENLEDFYKKIKYVKMYRQLSNKIPEVKPILYQMRKQVDFNNIPTNELGQIIPKRNEKAQKFREIMEKEFRKIGGEMVRILADDALFELDLSLLKKNPKVKEYEDNYRKANPDKLSITRFLLKYNYFVHTKVKQLASQLENTEEWDDLFAISADIIGETLESIMPVINEELHSIFNFLGKVINELDVRGKRAPFITHMHNLEKSFSKNTSITTKFDKFYTIIFIEHIANKIKNWGKIKPTNKKFTKSIAKFFKEFQQFLLDILNKLDMKTIHSDLKPDKMKEIEANVDAYMNMKFRFLTTVFVGSTPGMAQFMLSLNSLMLKKVRRYNEQVLFTNKIMFPETTNENLTDRLLHLVSILGVRTPENDDNEYRKVRYFQLNRKKRQAEVDQMRKHLENLGVMRLI